VLPGSLGESVKTVKEMTARFLRDAFCLPVVLVIAAIPASAQLAAPIALVGGTVVDVSDSGHSILDIHDATVLVRDGKITAVGPRGKISIPRNAKRIDIAGKYVVPGLVDGFTGLGSQAEANANLYMGVTTVVARTDDRRPQLLLNGNPTPHVYLLDSVGTTDNFALLAKRPEWAAKLKGRDPDAELSWEDTSRMMDEQARIGVKVLWLGHNLTPANTRRIITKARVLGIPTYGEFVATPYSDAIQEGVNVLLHMSRYELGLISPEEQQKLTKDSEGAAAQKAYASLVDIAPSDPVVSLYSASIVKHKVALMPTFSLFYADLPDHRNLWQEPVARILDSKTMFHSTNPRTGEIDYPSNEARQSRQDFANALWILNGIFFRDNPRYLAATGSSAFASMPGISMHVEMEMMVRLGLTPREALAAATSNYSDQFGWKELGLVAAGRRADLLVLDADPLKDIRASTHINMVLLEGAVIDRPALLTSGTPKPQH
jgi:hypothetical protein